MSPARTMPPEQAGLVARVRKLLAGQPAVREVAMFGGRAFLVEGRMILSVRKDGRLLVRVAGPRQSELLQRPGAGPAQMGRGRRMGPGWLLIEPEGLGGDDLLFWFSAAMERLRAGGE